MSETADMGRSTSDESGCKLQANSLREIVDALDLASITLREAVRGIGPKLRPGNLLNAFALWCLLQPKAEKEKIAREGLNALEELKSRDDPVNLSALDWNSFRGLSENLDSREDAAPHVAKPTGARKARKGKTV